MPARWRGLSIHGLDPSQWRGDLLGGLTAAVVALPLALAFGNAALGPGGAIYGLYGAIVTGFLAALFGGTPAQVSGPTGPMSVTVAGVVGSLAAVGVSRELGGGALLPLVMAAVVVGGLVQILIGLLDLGRYITLVPYSVVSGFMSGIGVIILLLQIGPLLGIASSGGVVQALSQVAGAFHPNPAALTIGAITLLVVVPASNRMMEGMMEGLGDDAGAMATGMKVGTAVGSMIGPIISMVYPILALVLLNKAPVKNFLAGK